MPKDDSISKILLIGSGPIVIGQGCEFDYSGVQACKALQEEGYEVVLVNSNPATIMTDPEFANKTYIEPLHPDVVEQIIIKEKPDALLPTLGGQTGLNTAMDLYRDGRLEKYGVKLIGANAEAIDKGEDRLLFKEAMIKIGLDVARSKVVKNMDEARQAEEEIGTYPIILRPAFTLGGAGGGIAYNREEYEALVARGIDLSPVGETLVEESLLGWKEYEMEVVRDKNDNCVIICAIENIDPMGIHTGDSITVAPAQTLSDREYQIMRDASFAVIREIGVETGGSNIQFCVHPETGRMIVIEMNPRVSRSSALASKATGFPIAKVAAKLAVGYTLDEIPNDITRETMAAFEPTIDYVVTKVPRFTFEKFPKADAVLTTQMKSVGEAMSIGRNFKESLQKALRSLETGRFGLGSDGKDYEVDLDTVKRKLSIPNAERIFYLHNAFHLGMTWEEIFELSKIDPWFLNQIQQIVKAEKEVVTKAKTDPYYLKRSKQLGFSDRQIAYINGGFDKNATVSEIAQAEQEIRDLRKEKSVLPTYRLVDTCASEFEAYTPYYYSTYGDENEARETDQKKIIILGGGPNRIGQGIEFDYCCVHASFALKELGYETIMVNSNPETVSTDYDTSDKLYFEPLTLEDVLNICDQEKPDGVIVQFGGQTPLNLAAGLEKAGVPIIGTSPNSIERAEDREEFRQLLEKLELKQAESDTAVTADEATKIASEIGYPVLVRPSFVLGGRAMMIVYDETELRHYMTNAVEVSPERPVLVDRFLDGATEVDVDVICDGDTTVIGAIMEHIEEAGIHSGDSACTIPPYSISSEMIQEITTSAKALAIELEVRGLMNIQFAVQNDKLYVIEVNPRASRTVPFVSKSIGVPLAKLAAKVMAGEKLVDLGFTKEIVPEHYSIKEAVFPFQRFPGIDISLTPEMKSTGEVMGIDDDFGQAFAKSQMGAGNALPETGRIFLSVKDQDKAKAIEIAKGYHELGFEIVSTSGTKQALHDAGVPAESVVRLKEGRPNILDRIKNGEIALIINTPAGKEPREDEVKIRAGAISNRVPIMTTLRAAEASLIALKALKKQKPEVTPIQDYQSKIKS